MVFEPFDQCKTSFGIRKVKERASWLLGPHRNSAIRAWWSVATSNFDASNEEGAKGFLGRCYLTNVGTGSK